MKRSWRLGVVITSIVAFGAAFWVVRRLAVDPAIPFLWPYSPAEWIIAPSPISLRVQQATPVDASFSRRFALASPPPSARLSVRAFRDAEVRVNGESVLAPEADTDWKRVRSLDIARNLRSGFNEIVVRVSNDRGPPALWLALELGEITLISDEQWRVSRAGGAETQAALARHPALTGSYDDFRLRRDLGDALRDKWPWLIGFLSMGSGVALLAWRGDGDALGKNGDRGRHRSGTALPVVLLAIAAAWCVLTVSAGYSIPIATGFDAEGHLEYIEHIRVTGELPAANVSWQAYHPPLYYAATAAILAGVGASAADTVGAWVIRGIGLGLGLASLLFVALSLRLIFPGDPRKQLFGLLFTGFLPVHLYIFQFPGNETLAVALGAFCFHACVRCLQDGARAGLRAQVLGLGLGAAMLAKISALLLVPPMLIALSWRAWTRPGPRPLRQAMSVSAVVVLGALVVCGWHYARVAARFGTPFAVNWGEPGVRSAWWQDPGYRTREDLFRLGPAIVAPTYAGKDGIVAGLYSSLWADSFGGGSAELEVAPPWDRELLALGPLAGLGLSVAICIGWLLTSVAAWRARDPVQALSPALALVAGGASVWMGLTVPQVGTGKASYAMVALTAPLAVLTATGLDWLAGHARWRSRMVLALLLAWAALSYSTYLVRGSEAGTFAFRGLKLLETGNGVQGIALLREAVAREPANWAARAALAESLFSAPEQRRALESELARSGPIDTAPPIVSMIVGQAELRAGRTEEAQKYLLRATEDEALVEPRLELALLHGRRGELEEAVRWAREALRLSPAVVLAHALLAEVYEKTGQSDLARYHSDYFRRLSGREMRPASR